MALFDEANDYVSEKHIHEFAKALIWDDNDDLDCLLTYSGGYALPRHVPADADDAAEAQDEAQALENGHLQNNSAVLAPVEPPREKPVLIKSKSDWFPVGSRIRHRREARDKVSATERLTDEFRRLALYVLFRWPVLVLVALWIVFLTGVYACVRAYVALLEHMFLWTGERKRLRDRLRASATYDEWVANATALDRFLGLDRWLDNPRFSYYDYHTVLKTTTRLRALRTNNDIPALMVFLQGCLKKNFAGIENRQLYSHRYYGTKKLVAHYIAEVVRCIDAVTAASAAQVPMRQKRRFFRIVSKNYGKTALCLSGGACFAYTHFGIVKALLDANLLPRIILGTSGGGLIAALACTRTDDELRQLLVPQLARKITACEDPWYVWIPRLWKTGARFDSVAWARKSNYFTKGSTTFQEAYKNTGRKLNISTVPAEPHLPVILCNTVTSPNCIIWLSLLASSAVPGILNPVVLMMKDPKTDAVTPFSLGNRWRDGSLRTDIPVEALNTYYNVNFSIVSQVNPHISLFFYAPKGTVGRPVAIPRRKTRKEHFASLRGGFIATALEQLLKLEVKKWLQVIKLLDLLPRWLEQDWLNVFLQRFTGTITIWPRNRFKDFWYILLDPSETQMAEYLRKGERSMFPRLLFVKHRLEIERAIERGREATRLTQFPPGSLTGRLHSPSAGLLSEDTADFKIADALEAAEEQYSSDLSEDDLKKRLVVSPFDKVYGSGTDDLPSDGATEESDRDLQDIGDVTSFTSMLSRGEAKHRRNTIF